MKKANHEIRILDLREQKKREQYRELREEFEQGKITWDYFYEKARKLFVPLKEKEKKKK